MVQHAVDRFQHPYRPPTTNHQHNHHQQNKNSSAATPRSPPRTRFGRPAAPRPLPARPSPLKHKAGGCSRRGTRRGSGWISPWSPRARWCRPGRATRTGRPRTRGWGAKRPAILSIWVGMCVRGRRVCPPAWLQTNPNPTTHDTYHTTGTSQGAAAWTSSWCSLRPPSSGSWGGRPTSPGSGPSTAAESSSPAVGALAAAMVVVGSRRRSTTLSRASSARAAGSRRTRVRCLLGVLYMWCVVRW